MTRAIALVRSQRGSRAAAVPLPNHKRPTVEVDMMTGQLGGHPLAAKLVSAAHHLHYVRFVSAK